MTFLSEPPPGLPFDVNQEWRQRAPKGCRNPKKLRVDYWKKYNHAEIPLRSRQDWYKLALKLAEEASTPEELERGFEAEYYNELRKQLELARKVCKKGRDGDSYNLQRATAEILNEKALASLLQLCSCLLYGWAEPDRSKRDMAEEEEAYLDRALQDPSLPLPSQTQHISLTKDGEDEDTSDNAVDTEPDSELDEFGPYEAPFTRDDCFDSIGQLKRPYPAYSIDVAAEKNSYAEPVLSAGTVGAHEHAKRDTARSVAESAQPPALPVTSSKEEPSSICNQSMTNKATPPSPPSTASPRSDSGAGAGCRSHNEESQPRQQPTSPASVPNPAATKKQKCGESVAIANGKCSDHTNSDLSPTKSTRRKRSRSESPFDADIEDQRFFKRRRKFIK